MTEGKFWRTFLLVLAATGAIVFVFRVWGILIPFFLGVAIAYMVYPIVDTFVAMGLRQDRVVMLLYLLLLGSFLIVGFLFMPLLIHQARAIAQELPSYSATLTRAIDQMNSQMQTTLSRWIGHRAGALSIPIHPDLLLDKLFISVPSNLPNVAHWGMWLIIIPFVSFFALTQGKTWINTIFQWTPSVYVEGLLGLMAEINATLGGYVRAQFLDAMAVGVLTILGLAGLGVEGAIFLGCITGLLNLVPFLALIVGGALSLMAAIFQGQSSSVLAGVFVLYIVVKIFDDFFFVPFVVGHHVRLHPVVMLFSVLAGFEVGGLLGLVFAIPCAAVIKVVLSVLWRSRSDSGLPIMPEVFS